MAFCRHRRALRRRLVHHAVRWRAIQPHVALLAAPQWERVPRNESCVGLHCDEHWKHGLPRRVKHSLFALPRYAHWTNGSPARVMFSQCLQPLDFVVSPHDLPRFHAWLRISLLRSVKQLRAFPRGWRKWPHEFPWHRWQVSQPPPRLRDFLPRRHHEQAGHAGHRQSWCAIDFPW